MSRCLCLVSRPSFRSLAAFSSSAGKTAKSKGEGSGRKKSPPKEVVKETVSPAADPQPNRPAGDAYLVPEYYAHNADTYADVNLEMSRYRLPRPVRPGH